MDNIWNGTFVKHRDYCRDITNHFGILGVSSEKVTPDDEAEEVWLVTATVGFIASAEQEYAYQYYVRKPNVSREEAEELVRQELLGQLN